MRYISKIGGFVLGLHGLAATTTTAAAESALSFNDLLDLPLEQLVELETTIASGKSVPIFKSVSTVSVVTAGDIERYRFRTVADAVRTIAGFDVYRTYFKNGIATSRGILQDHYANKVLVMINGTPSWHAISGEGNIDRINIRDVEKIEVLKGPASVLYGTNAYAGAINIVLKSQGEPYKSLYGVIGKQDHYAAGGSINIDNQEADSSLFLSLHGDHEARKNLSFTDEAGISDSIDDYIDTQNFTIDARYKNHQFLFSAYDNSEVFMGITPYYSAGAGFEHDVRGYLLGYKYLTPLTDASDIRFSLTYDWNERDFIRSIINDSRSETDGYRLASTVTYDLRFADYFNFDIGMDYESRVSNQYRNYLATDGSTLAHNNMQDQSVWEGSVFSNLGYEKNKWSWIIGVRSTINEYFKNSVSGRATLVYSLSNTSSLKFIASESYRSPSLFELYFLSPEQTVFGNLDLEPEKSTSYEIAFLKSFGNLFTQSNIYYANYSNKIFRIQDDVTLPDGTVLADKLIYTNGSKFDVVGFEMEARYTLDSWSTFVNFNYQNGGNGDRIPDTDHYNFKYIPDYTLSAGLSKTINEIILASVFNYKDSTQGSTDADISSSLTIDLSASYSQAVSENATLRHIVRFSNITDERVEIADYARRGGIPAIPYTDGNALSYELELSY